MTPRSWGASRSLIVGFVFLGLAIAGTGWLVEWQQRGAFWITRTWQVEDALGTVLSRLQDEENGTQLFLLAQDRRALQRADQARRDARSNLGDLSRLVQDNPTQASAAQTLGRLIADLEETLQQARADPSKAAEIASLAQVRISAVHQQIDAMRSEEIKLLALRQAGAAKILIVARVARIACVMATLWLAWLAYAEARKRLVEATTVKDDLARTVAMLEAEGRTRAEAEATVRQMQKMEAIGQLTGGIAHDFNNMLAVVIGSLEMANRRLGHDQAKAQLYITNAAEAASRAAQLTARLLAFARRQPLAPEPVDANRLVSGMSDLLERTLGEQMSVKTILAEGLWLASVDPAQLENAILNLCVNGRDAMPDGGRLTVETSNCDLGEVDLMELQDVPAGPYVVIAVKDTGTGMTPDVVARAFDPFFTTKGVGKGTGLGLSQVFGFVKQSGGQVKILSDVGQGTCVRIYLPRYFGPVPTLAAVPTSPHLSPAGGEEIVLVVEDEDPVRQMSVDALREVGYTVIQAANGAQALETMALEPRVDLLFTDIVIPDMSGLRLAELARQARPSIAVLYTTGYSPNAVIQNLQRGDGVVLLQKPFTLADLARKVRQVLDGQKELWP